MDSVSLPRMPWHQKLAFSLGHIFNDLCATMWFSMLLLFLKYIAKFPDNEAGYMLLWGQVVDAVCTPLIGYESDRIRGCRCLGKRKTWHLVGSVAVLVSFPFIFMKCIQCENAEVWQQMIYYAPFIAIFQAGWASVQIAHMALISQLTDSASEKTELSGLRNAGTLLSSIIVFMVTWIFFGADKGATWTDDDAFNIVKVMIIVVCLGSLCTIVFHVLLREASPDDDTNSAVVINVERGLSSDAMTWFDWLKEHQFYLVALIYMLSRLVVNVSGTYWPLYVLNSLHMEKKYVAIIPLTVNITGFVVSLLMRIISDKIGRKMALLLGAVVTLAGCVWLYFIQSDHLQVIGPAILIGGGGSILIVTSLAMTTDVIGVHKSSGAFVFGAMSFTDKLSNGVAVMLLQQFSPCRDVTACLDGSNFYRFVMAIIVAAFTGAVCLVLFFIWPQRLGHLRKFANVDSVERPNGAENDEGHGSDDDDDTGDERRTLLNHGHRRKVRSYVEPDGSAINAAGRTASAIINRPAASISA